MWSARNDKIYFLFEIIYYNRHYYKPLVQKLWTFHSNGFRKKNTATWLNHRKQFFKGFTIIFLYCAKHASCIQGCFKKVDIQFKCNVWRYEDEENKTLKAPPLISEYTVKSNPCLPHQVKRYDQFRINEQDTNSFDHLLEKSTKPLVNVSALHFLNNLRVLRRSEKTLIEWERDGDVLVVLFSHLILVERSLLNSNFWNQQFREDMKNSIIEERN